MFTFAKGFVYKFCFCLGLGTATYYSYGTVQKWIQHDQVKVVENVVEKHVIRENTVYDDAYVPQEISYEQPASAASSLSGIGDEIKESTPVASSSEEVREEKKEENAEKKEEASEEVVAGVNTSNQNLPMAYVPQGPAPASASTTSFPEGQGSASAIPILPDVLPSPNPVNSGNSGFSSTSTLASSGSFLDHNDIAALIAPLKASFSDEMNQSNGLLCVVGGHSCERRNRVSVHSLRWGMEEGLKKDVKFNIKSIGTTSLEFAFDFKIQNNTLSEENISISARPTDILVHNESRDSKTYRVIEFRFPDLSVRGESIKQVQATMVYEVTTNGLVLSKDSGLSFTRSKVELLVSEWSAIDPATVDRMPAAQGGVFLIADELSFSMNIEKP